MPDPDEGRELEVPWDGTYQQGFRAWRLRFKGEAPRLGAVVHQSVWEPGEGGAVQSDFDPATDGPFAKSTKGLYMLKTLADVKAHDYHERGNLVGAITPFGKIHHGPVGYRATHAKVQVIFRSRKTNSCEVCGKAAHLVIRLEGEPDAFWICSRCRVLLSEWLRAATVLGEYTSEEIMQALADAYEAEIADEPED